MPDNPALRVSDADRERVSAQLRDAFAEGRLTAEEFDERNDRALAAKTAADLAPLIADLPEPARPIPDDAAAAAAAAERARRRELRKVWVAWASAAIVLTAVWALTAIGSGGVPAYWPAWPLGITGAMAVVRTLTLRAGADPREAINARKAAGLGRRADRRLPR